MATSGNKEKMGLLKTYKGYRLYHASWVNTLGETRHTVIALKARPNSTEFQKLYGQAWSEDETHNEGRGFPLVFGDYSDKASAVAKAGDAINSRLLHAKQASSPGKTGRDGTRRIKPPIRGVDTPGRGRIQPGVGYADKGKQRLSRQKHKGFRKIKTV